MTSDTSSSSHTMDLTMTSQSPSDIPSSSHQTDLSMASQSLSDMPSTSHETDITMTSQPPSDIPSSSHNVELTTGSQFLSDLPPEVVIGIFTCLKDHHAITALNLTSRKFYEIWKLNTATIIKAVLQRAIDCFDLAQELLDLQGRSPISPPFGTREAVLERSKRLLTNAAVLLSERNCRISDFDAGKHVASLQYRYVFWICIELCKDREARDSRLHAATLQELRGMVKSVEWFQLESVYGDGRVDQRGVNTTWDAITATLRLKESLS